MSGIRLQGLTISRFEKDAVFADFALGDLTDVQLRVERRGGDWFLIVFCLLLVGVAAACIVFWAIPANTRGGWLGAGIGGALSLFFLAASFRSKSAVLFLRGKHIDRVELPIQEPLDRAELFFREIQEHASKAGLRTSFKIDRH